MLLDEKPKKECSRRLNIEILPAHCKLMDLNKAVYPLDPAKVIGLGNWMEDGTSHRYEAQVELSAREHFYHF